MGDESRRWVSTADTGLSEPLARMVDLLTGLLAGVIRRQAGDETFERIVDLQRCCHRAAQSGDPDAQADLARRIAALDLDRIFWICRAYTVLFHLLNEAERKEITRINREAETAETDDSPRSDSIREAVVFLKQRDAGADRIQAIVDSLEILPTLTAHPTEARRGSILFKQNRIAEFLARHSREPAGGPERAALVERIAHEIGLMMVTDDVRSERLRVEDEVKNGLYYQTRSIWEAVPRIFRDLRRALSRECGIEAEIPPVLRYRSWIGGDRDGNPFVTHRLTADTLRAHRTAALENYRRELRRLWQELSISSLRVEVPGPLQRDLERERAEIPLGKDYLHRYRREPFRLKIGYMIERIDGLLGEREASSYSPARFREDLDLLANSLKGGGLSALAGYRSLSDLRVRSRVFGFHLAALDVRQHSRVHEAAVEELLAAAGVAPDYRSLSADEKMAVLEAELANPRPLTGRWTVRSESTEEILRVMELVGDTLRTDPEAIGGYVISMTHAVHHLLEALLLAKEANLWRIRDGRVDTPLDLVPLFETIDDLERAEGLLDELFTHRLYRAHLDARGRFQEIMLGYSDSNKDGGYWMANHALHQGQQRLARACVRHRIRFRFFHGRGGSAGRGGGRANLAIFAMPVESRNGRIRFTEQGEIISFRYARPAIARRHLEQIVNAMMRTAGDTYCDEGCSPAMQGMMARIAAGSMETYRRLIEADGFWDWFREITPIEQIGRLPIASRPVSRGSGRALEFEELRAIPWVFSWTQTRYNLPGWYGAGRVLEREIAADPQALALLREMYRSWPFFRSVLENVELELARTRMPTARAYSRLSDRQFHEAIETEYGLTRRAVLRITGRSRLLDNHPAIRDTIAFRNPYTDLLNRVQVELLRRWREDGGPEGAGALRHALFLTINGIAAAMQSTG